MSIHPAAAPFSLALRERVAHGPLFDRQNAAWPFAAFANDENGTCCWLALAEAEPDTCKLVNDEDIDDLIARNDGGRYCCRAHLIFDLLGVEATGLAGAGEQGAGA